MNVVVVAPHIDDESFGCGGTILRHKSEGDNVSCIFVTCDPAECSFVPPPPFSLKKQQTDYVERAYGFNKVFWMKYPAAHLDTISMQEIVSKIADIFKQTIPEVVYVPSRTDIHSDHRVVFDAVFACTKRFRYLSVKKVLMYETVSETEQAPALMDRAFIPNYYVDITKFFKQKMDIMKNAYHMELERPPFPRSVKNVEALATFRGSTMGIKFAEAFHLLKWIV